MGERAYAANSLWDGQVLKSGPASTEAGLLDEALSLFPPGLFVAPPAPPDMVQKTRAALTQIDISILTNFEEYLRIT